MSVTPEVHAPHCSRVSLVFLVVTRSGTLHCHFPRNARGHLLDQCLPHPYLELASKGSARPRESEPGVWTLQNDPMR